MKKVILLVIMGLVASGGMKEAGAMACGSGSNTGAGITGGSHGVTPGGPDCVSGHEMMASQSGMAGHEGTGSYCYRVGPVNSEAINVHFGSHQNRNANETQSPMGQKGETTPDLLPAARK